MSAPQPASTLLRIACDSVRLNQPTNQLTNQTPAIALCAACRIELALFVNGVLADVSALTSLTLELKPLNESNQAPTPYTLPLASVTTSIFDNACTSETWASGTGKHCALELTQDQLNQEPGQLWLLIYGVNTAGARIIFMAGQITGLATGGPSVAEPPPAAPLFYTAAESDARFERIGGGSVKIILPAGVDAVRFNEDGSFDLVRIT